MATVAVLAKEEKEKSVFVKIETNYGTMKVRLYNETPLHRDNFVKLVKEDFYEGLLFHRVIKDFMIQCGDPESKNVNSDKRLGAGGTDYTLEAEIKFPQLYHKRGALAAARKGDQVNPEKRSSGCQFYIVQGKCFTDDELDMFEKSVDRALQQQVFQSIMKESEDSLKTLRNEGKIKEAEVLQRETYLKAQKMATEKNPFKYSDEQRRYYKTFGGTPHLDAQYTVFGELVDGFNVLDEIAKVETGVADRPKEDVVVLKMKIVKN